VQQLIFNNTHEDQGATRRRAMMALLRSVARILDALKGSGVSGEVKMKAYRTITLLTALWASIASGVEIQSLQGCCSYHGGIANVCLASGYELCNDGTQSPTCTCSYTSPPPVVITPQLGMWWNPAESGNGYSIGRSGSSIVITVFSYTPQGAPIWYLAFGPLINNTVTGTLNTFINGQCISCAYKPPTANSNDGTATVTFNSATSATMTLPGTRVFNIVPQ
jgi:hypothetical protein